MELKYNVVGQILDAIADEDWPSNAEWDRGDACELIAYTGKYEGNLSLVYVITRLTDGWIGLLIRTITYTSCTITATVHPDMKHLLHTGIKHKDTANSLVTDLKLDVSLQAGLPNLST